MSSIDSKLKKGDEISGKVVEIFAATRNTDSAEGRGSQVDEAYYLTREGATIGAHKIDVMGTDGKVESRLAIEISGKLTSYVTFKEIVVRDDPKNVEALREQALKKLSPAERVVLGLK